MNVPAPTVIVADDHALTRNSIAQTLSNAAFDVVAVGPDAPTAIALAAEHRPDICLLDVQMPGNGIDAARQISRTVTKTSVVMLTVLQDDDTLFEAFRAGARGYLIKGMDASNMVGALKSLLAGEPALSPGIAMRILEHLGSNQTRRFSVPDRGMVQLSHREADVLDLLRQGLRTNDIARRLFISQATVRTHVAGILRKLNVSSREEALRLIDG